MPAGGASSPAGEVVGRDQGPVRTLWASQLGPRRLVACRPREQRSAGGCYSGDGAMAAAVAGKGEPKGQRTTGKVMPSLVRMEEGPSGGSSSVRSSARLVHGGRALARACGTEAREEASREARASAGEAPSEPGAAPPRRQHAGTRGRAVGRSIRAWPPRPGQVLPIRAFPRARGG